MVNGEIALTTGTCKAMAGYLVDIPLQKRQSALDAMLAVLPEGSEITAALFQRPIRWDRGRKRRQPVAKCGSRRIVDHARTR